MQFLHEGNVNWYLYKEFQSQLDSLNTTLKDEEE